MFVVSNSLVTAHNTCKRRAYYMSIIGVEPILLPLPLYRGIVGHRAWDAYYREKQNVEAGKDVLREELHEIMKREPDALDHITAVGNLFPLLDRYHEWYQTEPFEVLEIEQEYRVPINDDLLYAMRLDMLVRFTGGPFRGDIAVVDHKFVYNFKSQTEIKLDAQLPKYIRTLREKGYIVNRGVFNQIRHRQMKNPPPEKLFKREFLTATDIEIETIWEEQTEAALELYNWDGRPPRRTLNPLVCKGCPFDRLCKKELVGESTNNMLKFEFRPTTYGYTGTDE